MNKWKIYIIASVSSLFIGVSVGTLVMNSKIPDWAVFLGIAATAGGMMIEITVPEMLIAVWSRASKPYRIVAIIATVATPALLIFALSDIGGIAQFSIAFIVASLVAYLSFYAAERMKKTELDEQKLTTIKDASRVAIEERERLAKFEFEIEIKRQQELTRIEVEKQTVLASIETERLAKLEKVKAIEERKTRKALAKMQAQDILPLTRDAVIDIVRSESGISQRELGRRFGNAPKTVLSRVSDLVSEGVITANGKNGVVYIGQSNKE